MMTCKDCKIYDECKSPMKDMDDADAMETWAMWCDAFESIHEDKTVETDKHIIVQSGLNWHVQIYDKATHKMIAHFSCTRELTEKELKELEGVLNDVIHQ